MEELIAAGSSLIIPDPVTFDEVLAFARLCKWRPKEKFQERIIGELCEYRHCVLQGLRQNVGKTECVAIVKATALQKGRNVGVGTPTLEVGGRVVVDRIARFMYRAEAHGGVPSTKPDAVKFKTYENGAYMGLVSLYDSGDEMKGKGVQGWTFHDLIIDEAHEGKKAVFDKLVPTTNVAAEENKETSVCIGIGGVWAEEEEDCSLIELRKETEGVHSILVTVEELLEQNHDRFIGPIEKAKRELSEVAYRQNVLCERIYLRGDAMFPKLEPFGDPGYLGCDSWFEFSIDVGDSAKGTVVSAWEILGNFPFKRMDAVTLDAICEIDGTLDYPEQVRLAAEFILKYEGRFNINDITVEKNAGKRFIAAARKVHPFRALKTMWTSDSNEKGKPGHGRKSRWLEKIMDMASSGKLGVRDEKARRHLKRLQYQVNPDGSYDWPHSHILSTCWIWYSRRGAAFGV